MSANISPMEQRRDTPSSEDGSRSNRNSASKKANEEEEKSTAKNNRAKPADKGESSKADKQNKATEKSKTQAKSQNNCADKKQSVSDNSCNSGGPKQTCENCSNEFTELHFCVHCANSICAKCRCKHIEKQVEEFAKIREETTTNQRSVNKKVQKLTTLVEDLQREEESNLRAIDSDFKEIEKILLARKNALKKELKQKYAQQTKPLNDQKRVLEKEFGTINSKFEGILRNISLPPSNAPLSAYGKIKNPDFAQLCGFTVKCGECNTSFGELKNKAEEVKDSVNMIDYDYKTGSSEMVTELKTHGEVKFKEKVKFSGGPDLTLNYKKTEKLWVRCQNRFT